MNTLSRKIIVLAIAVTMVFAVAVLGGCGVTPELTLQQQADAIGAQVYYWQNGGNPTLDDIDALLTHLAELRAEVKRLQGENDALLAQIDKYEGQLEALQRKLEDMKNSEREIDFVLRFEAVNMTAAGSEIKAIVSSLAEWNALDLYFCEFAPVSLGNINEEFFANNSLVVFSFIMGQGGNQFVEVNLNRDGNKLKMDATINAGILDVITRGVIVIEVSNASLISVDSLEVTLKGICPQIWGGNI